MLEVPGSSRVCRKHCCHSGMLVVFGGVDIRGHVYDLELSDYRFVTFIASGLILVPLSDAISETVITLRNIRV